MHKFAIALVAFAVSGLSMESALGDALSDCSCVAVPTNSSKIVGTIVQSSGDVIYSDVSGYSRAIVGARLFTGSQITTGQRAFANISVGSSCNLNIPANSEAFISQPKGASGKLCVKVVRLSDPMNGLTQEGTSTSEAPFVPKQIILATPVILASGIVLATGVGNSAASP